MEKLTLDKLEAHLWQSANILRGSIDSGSYKNYIFGLLFLKRTNDEFDEKRNQLVQQYGEEIADVKSHYQFYVPEDARWENLRKVSENIGSAINVAFEALENENATLFKVLTPTDFNNKDVLTDELLQRLLQHFSTINLANNQLSEPDMLGRAYEFLIKQFADDSGKKGGEFYTPSKVVNLIVRLIKPQEGMKIYDPTAGSGGMLIQSVDYIKQHGGNPKSVSIYGQERNLETWAISRMNLLLHDLPDHTLERGDTLRNPLLLEDGEIKTFDRVLSNPPFSLKEWGVDEARSDPYGRFIYEIPPKSYGDYAFIQHILASMNGSAMAGIVMAHGVLFRGGTEGKIRQEILEADLLEAVIGLPPSLFYGTSIPACILIFNRHKPDQRKGKVLFISAEDEYQEGKNQNVLREEDVKKIATIFDTYEEIEKYAKVVPLEDIRENEYNLNISRYVDKSDEEEFIDIENILNELKEIKVKKEKNTKQLNMYIEELELGGLL